MKWVKLNNIFSVNSFFHHSDRTRHANHFFTKIINRQVYSFSVIIQVIDHSDLLFKHFHLLFTLLYLFFELPDSGFGRP